MHDGYCQLKLRDICINQVATILCNCSGTVKDDKIQFVPPNGQNGREWYDRLASESDRTVTSEDIGPLATTEGEMSSEMLHHHMNDTDELK